MAAIYNVEGHTQLSAAARALDGAALDALAEAAERLQDLRGRRVYGGDDAETARLVVVYQINKMILDGVTLSPVASVGRGSRSVSYRVDSGGRALMLDERASQLRDDLRSWGNLVSRR